MGNQFEFYGLKTNKRREIEKPFLIKQYLSCIPSAKSPLLFDDIHTKYTPV